MSHTYTNLLMHVIFSTEDRESLISAALHDERYILVVISFAPDGARVGGGGRFPHGLRHGLRSFARFTG